MMRNHKPPKEFQIEDEVWERTLFWEEEPVLTLSLRRPKLPEDTPGLRRMERYYRQVAEQWKARWEGPLYAQAQAAAGQARQSSRPFRPWEATLTFTVTYRQEGLLSLYTDTFEYTGGVHGLTVRRGDTWQVPSGIPRTLQSFFPPRARWRSQIYGEIRRQIQARIHSGESLFADDWEQRLVPEFDPERFYLTPNGIAVFYPLYAIAPYAEGIPVFLLPFPSTEEAV